MAAYQPSPDQRLLLASVQLEPKSWSVQLAPEAIASSARIRTEVNTPWTLKRHVIPKIPLCFSNYARSGSKYA